MSRLSARVSSGGPSPAPLTLLVCALGFGLDQTQLQMGGALAAIFSAPPYSLDPHRLSWLLSAVYVGGCIGAPLLGRAADRRGVRRVLRWTVVWLGVTSLLSAVSDDSSWLAVSRLLMGISLGAYPPLMVAYLSSIAPENQRGRWILWTCGLAYVAAPVSLFALRSLTDLHPAGLAGWRWLAVGVGAAALLASHLFRSLPEPSRPPAEASGTSERSGFRQLVGAPLRRTFTLVAALYFLYPWATAAFFLLTGPLLLQRGFTLSTALWYVSFATVWPAIGTFAAAWLIDRIPRRTAMLMCCAVMLLAALCFFAGTTLLSLSVALVAFGVAQALYPAVMSTLGAESFPVTVRATATSVAWALNRAAAFLVPVTLLPLLHSFGPVSVGVCVTGALTLSAGLTFAFGSPGSAHRGARPNAFATPGAPSIESAGQ